MEDFNYLSKEGLLYVWQKIKLKLSNKVDKVEGKGLSTNDLTDELKDKILKAGDSSFSGNYDDLINKPIIPTNNNQLENGAGYQTSTEVASAITNAIAGVTQFDYAIVEELPETGVKGTIYLIKNQEEEGSNIYDEYIFINGKPEKFGTAEVDLTGYVKESDLNTILASYIKKSELQEITNTEIDEIFAE